MTNNFEIYDNLWVTDVLKITDHPDHFSNLVDDKRKSVKDVYMYLEPIHKHFAKVITGEANSRCDNNQINEGLSINRSLGKKSLENLAEETSKKIKQTLYVALNYGLLGHLYFGNFPSRDKFNQVDLISL